MDCNKKCYWNFDGLCVSDNEENYENGNPKENEKCENWLREDFEEALKRTYDEVVNLAWHRNLKQLEEIKEFILKQEGEE